MTEKSTSTKIKIFGAEFSLHTHSRLVDGGVFLLCFAFAGFMLLAGMSMIMGNTANVEPLLDGGAAASAQVLNNDSGNVAYDISESTDYTGLIIGSIAFLGLTGIMYFGSVNLINAFRKWIFNSFLV